MTWEVEKSIRLLDIVSKFTISREGHEELVDFCNSLLQDIGRPTSTQLLSPYLTKAALAELYPVTPKAYKDCSNGCKMFRDDGNAEELCSCEKKKGKRRSTGNIARSVPRGVVQQLSLSEQLALLLADPETRKLMRYRHDRQPSEPGVYRDVFHGKAYRFKQHLFTSENDIALSMFVDGFQPHKRMNHTLTLVHFVVLNYPPEIRYERNRMLQVSASSFYDTLPK